MSNDINLSHLLDQIKPSMVTPHLNDVTAVNNEKKIKVVAKLIVKQMADNYNRSNEYKTPHLIMHDGKSIAVRFLNIEPLLTGIWSAMSLCLLQLSYGEQSTLIEAIYPSGTQLAAKSFAAIFTISETEDKPELSIHEDDDIVGKLDSANAGIALILAMMDGQGYKTPHPDEIALKLKDMDSLVEDEKQAQHFQRQSKRAHDANQAKYHQ